jgi:hypothetical protein
LAGKIYLPGTSDLQNDDASMAGPVIPAARALIATDRLSPIATAQMKTRVGFK